MLVPPTSGNGVRVRSGAVGFGWAILSKSRNAKDPSRGRGAFRDRSWGLAASRRDDLVRRDARAGHQARTTARFLRTRRTRAMPPRTPAQAMTVVGSGTGTGSAVPP